MRWDPTASSSAGKCKDDEDGGRIPPSSSWVQSSEGIDKQDKAVVGFFTSSWVQTSLGRVLSACFAVLALILA